MSDSIIGMTVKTGQFWNGEPLVGKVVAVKYNKNIEEFVGLILTSEGDLVSVSLYGASVKEQP